MVIPVLVWWFCLPDPLFDASYSTVLLDRSGQLMGARLAKDGQWRFPGDELEVPAVSYTHLTLPTSDLV